MRRDFRFFILTCRSPATDFRVALADSLRKNYETYYIWLKRKPELTYPDGRKAIFSFPQLLQFMRNFAPDQKTNVYFNSTNTSFPFVTAIMKYLVPRGIWCLDMHDDLRYHYEGFELFRTIVGIRVMRLFSDITVHAAPTLKELFPNSQHLGNASNIRRIAHDGVDPHSVLILASLDDRFDFDLMEKTARECPGLTFHIYGQVSQDLAHIKEQLLTLQKNGANINYHGSYGLSDLPDILGRYTTMFAPYIVDLDLTRYIDPLRFYHGLNAGLRLVTTAIPQALYMHDSLTVIRNADEAAAALKAGNVPAKIYEPITWDQRAAQLIEILNAA